MTLVLDTDALPVRDRADAVAVAMAVAGVPAHVRHEDPHGAVQARIELRREVCDVSLTFVQRWVAP